MPTPFPPSTLRTPPGRRITSWVAAATIVALASSGELARAQGPWTIQTADAGQGSGNTSSLRLDPAGRPRVAEWMTGSGGVRYAEFNGSQWSAQTVPVTYYSILEAPYGRSPALHDQPAVVDPLNTQLLITTATSLALDSEGNPWIAWVTTDRLNHTPTMHPVSVTYRSGGVWTTEALEAGVNRPVVEADGSGRVHVCFETSLDAFHNLRYAVREAGVWTYETVDARASSPDLRLDGQGNPHVLYLDETRNVLVYAVRNGTGWDRTDVPVPNSPGDFALAVDPDGQARVAVADYVVNYQPQIHYLEQQGTSWQISTADPSTSNKFDLSLALNPAGAPVISYNDQNGLDLKVATRAAGIWTREIVDGEGNTGYSSSVAVTTDGRPFVSYQAESGTRVATGTAMVGVEPGEVPRTLRLVGPHPNPVRLGTPLALSLQLPVATSVRLEAFDVSGRRVCEPLVAQMNAGRNPVSWNPSFESPGVYVLRAITGRGEAVTKRIAVVR
jgi:hypothetical protein